MMTAASSQTIQKERRGGAIKQMRLSVTIGEDNMNVYYSIPAFLCRLENFKTKKLEKSK